MDSIPCDIVLLPSPLITKIAYAASEGLKDQNTLFTLKEDEYYPHVSLYMVQLSLGSIENVGVALKKIAQSTSPINLTAKEFHQELGYFDVEYMRNEIIDGVQNKVLEAINPLRDGLRKNDEERLKTSTGIELDNLQKYGYRSVGSKFSPHLTLTRFIEEDTKSSVSADLDKFDGIFVSIGLFEMGDNGTCVRKILEIPLS